MLTLICDASRVDGCTNSIADSLTTCKCCKMYVHLLLWVGKPARNAYPPMQPSRCSGSYPLLLAQLLPAGCNRRHQVILSTETDYSFAVRCRNHGILFSCPSGRSSSYLPSMPRFLTYSANDPSASVETKFQALPSSLQRGFRDSGI